LAQGSSYQRNVEKTIEDEIEEKKRFVPPHLQINLELLDCIFMTTSLFLEIPNIHQSRFTVSKNIISKNFRKLIEFYEQNSMQFVPQSNRDLVV